jgi:hypothetical protein
LTREQAFTLLLPVESAQCAFFLNKYRTDKAFAKKWNSKIDEYRKDPFVLVSADASQAEVRIASSLSNERHLIDNLYRKQLEADLQGLDTDKVPELDLHIRTAAAIAGIPFDQVTKDQRRGAKRITFGTMYGATEFRIALESNISVGEAKKLLDKFWAAYPDLWKWTIKLVAEGVTYGYVETPNGRRKACPTLKDKKEFLACFIHGKSPWQVLKNKYSYGVIKQVMREIRQIRNFPVQSFTSDYITNGAYLLTEECKKRGIEMVFHTIVHDALVASVRYSRLKEYLALMKRIMEKDVVEQMGIICPMKMDQEVGFGYHSLMKVKYLLDNEDWNTLPARMVDQARKVKAATIIGQVGENSLFLFKPENQKPYLLTSKEVKETGISNDSFRQMFASYRKRWNLSPEALQAVYEELMPLVETVYERPDFAEAAKMGDDHK